MPCGRQVHFVPYDVRDGHADQRERLDEGMGCWSWTVNLPRGPGP